MSGPHWGAAHLDHGLLENGEQPGSSVDGNWRVLLDGEVLNLEDLFARYRIAHEHQRPLGAGACAELIASQGPEIVEQFNGCFALVVCDNRAQRLLLISDRHGTRPLFYRDVAGTVAFATELKGILAAQPDNIGMDATAVCEQLVYGVHFSGRSWLAGCQRVEPACIVAIGGAEITRRRYWDYRYRYAAATLSQSSYSTNFAVLLDRAVERCMRGTKRIGMFLSGGYDSRSVAASIRSHHLPIPAFTFGEPQSRDMQIAPLLATRLGLTHIAVPPVKPYLFPNAGAIVWRTEGLLPFSSATSARVHDVLCRHMDIFLTGFLGEFSGSHTWPALLLARSRKATIEAIYRRFVAPRIQRAQMVLRPEVFAPAFEELRNRFFDSFAAIANDHPMDVADAWNFTYLQPGGSFQAPAVDRHRLEMRAPHLDKDVVDFLLTVPPRARIEQRVYKRMIADAFPSIRDVPCANSMRPIEPRFWLEYPQMVAGFIGRKISARARRAIGREDRLGREISDLDADVRGEVELRTRLLEPLLETGCLDDTIFSHDAVARLTRDHYANRGDCGQLLMQLISLGLAVRTLVRNEVDDVPLPYRVAESH